MKIWIKVLACLATLGWGAQTIAQETAGSSPAGSIAISSNETEVYPLTFFRRVLWAGSTLLDPEGANTPSLLYSYKICMKAPSEDLQDEECLSDGKITAALNEVAKNKKVRAAILDLSTGKAQAIVITDFKKAQGTTVFREWRDALRISRNGNGESFGKAIAFTRPLKSTGSSINAEKFIAPPTLWASYVGMAELDQPRKRQN